MATCKHCKSNRAKPSGFCCGHCQTQFNAPATAERRARMKAEAKKKAAAKAAVMAERVKARAAVRAAAKAAKAAALATRPTFARECQRCGEPYETQRRQQIYCAIGCGKAAAIERAAEKLARRTRMTDLPDMHPDAELAGLETPLVGDPRWPRLARRLVSALPCRPIDLRTSGHRQSLAWAEGRGLARYAGGEWRRTVHGDAWLDWTQGQAENTL